MKNLHLIKKSTANYNYFFKLITSQQNASWLGWLVENDFFTDPLAVTTDHKGRSISTWWPIRYLASVTEKDPDGVTGVITQLKVINNPSIISELMGIALKLPVDYSITIKDKIFDYIKASDSLLGDNMPAKLLVRWVADDMLDVALEFLQVLVQRTDKIYCTSWQCQQLLDDGLLPLIEEKPLEVARVLVIALQAQSLTASYGYGYEQNFSDLDDVTFTKTVHQALILSCEDVYQQKN